MYGFHKIPQLQQGAHPHFRRGEPHLLNFIQRKQQVAQAAQANASANGETPTESGWVLDIVHELGAIKHLQSLIQAELMEVKQLNLAAAVARRYRCEGEVPETGRYRQQDRQVLTWFALHG
jgi:heat shock transcription factor